MEFSDDNFTVWVDGTEVELLRKEFLLLKFLYVNKGKTFSRADLLDAIWTLENPTDRTVDDHIYRLRKKLHLVRDTVTIKTVKGLGYRLEMVEQTTGKQETVPEEIAQQTNQLFETYYKYGQGKALKEMLGNKALGLPLREKQEMVMLWLQSDFSSLLKKLSQTESYFVPLLLYSFVESDIRKVINAHEKALEKKGLDEKERMDITCFSLPFLYLRLDQPQKSLLLIQDELASITTNNHGFLPFLHIMKTIILFYEDKMEEAEASLRKSVNILGQYPFLRESAALRVVQGVFSIKKGNALEGERKIEEGIQTVHQSSHTYYFHVIYQMLGLLLPKSGATNTMIEHYQTKADSYYKNLNVDDLKPDVEKIIFSFI